MVAHRATHTTGPWLRRLVDAVPNGVALEVDDFEVRDGTSDERRGCAVRRPLVFDGSRRTLGPMKQTALALN
jgi:hypothetical protein